MSRGGFRQNAPLFRRSWYLGETKTIRVPVAIAESVLACARVIDNYWHESQGQKLPPDEAKRKVWEETKEIIYDCVDSLASTFLVTTTERLNKPSIQSSLSKITENLSKWDQNQFESSDWQPLQSLLPNIQFARRSRNKSISRGKKINIDHQAMPTLVLVAQVTPKIAQEEAEVVLQVYPVGISPLPEGLKLEVLDEMGITTDQTQAKSASDLIQVGIIGKLGEQFSAKITVGDFSYTEYFEI